VRILTEINGVPFFEDWKKDNENSDRENNHRDDNSWERFELYKTIPELHFYKIEIEQKDVSELYLPNHNHENYVGVDGMSLTEYSNLYSDTINDPPKSNDRCKIRIKRVLEWFDTPMDESLFMFVSDNPSLAVRGNFGKRTMEEGRLFAGSSHKFAAYSIWIAKNGFIPLNVYYLTY